MPQDSQVSNWLIDPPSYFDTIAAWQAFLTRMESLPQDDPNVAAGIEDAKQMIAEKLQG